MNIDEFNKHFEQECLAKDNFFIVDFLSVTPGTTLFYDLARAVYESIYFSTLKGKEIIFYNHCLDKIAVIIRKAIFELKVPKENEDIFFDELLSCTRSIYILTATTKEIDSRVLFVPDHDACSLGEVYDFNYINDWETFKALVKQRI